MVDKARQGRNNKQRGASYEREVARILGGTRHKADTGGPEDIRHPWLAVQIKSGLTVGSVALRDGMALARAAAAGTNKLPATVLVDRRGTRLQRFICFDLEAFADWYGCGEREGAA